MNKLNDMDWQEICNKYNLSIHYDSLRKASQTIFGGAFVYEYFNSKGVFNNIDNYAKELQTQKDELYKMKRQVADQRREYSKLLTSDARSDHLTEKLIEIAKKLNQEKALNFNHNIKGTSKNSSQDEYKNGKKNGIIET